MNNANKGANSRSGSGGSTGAKRASETSSRSSRSRVRSQSLVVGVGRSRSASASARNVQSSSISSSSSSSKRSRSKGPSVKKRIGGMDWRKVTEVAKGYRPLTEDKVEATLDEETLDEATLLEATLAEVEKITCLQPPEPKYEREVRTKPSPAAASVPTVPSSRASEEEPKPPNYKREVTQPSTAGSVPVSSSSQASEEQPEGRREGESLRDFWTRRDQKKRCSNSGSTTNVASLVAKPCPPSRKEDESLRDDCSSSARKRPDDAGMASLSVLDLEQQVSTEKGHAMELERDAAMERHFLVLAQLELAREELAQVRVRHEKELCEARTEVGKLSHRDSRDELQQKEKLKVVLKDNKDLNEIVKTGQSALESKSRELDLMKEKFDAREKEIADAKLERDAAIEQQESLLAEIEITREELCDAQTEVGNLNRHVKEGEEVSGHHVKQQEAAQIKLDAAKDALKATKNELASKEGEISKLNDAIIELNEVWKDSQSALESKGREFDRIQNMLEAREREIAELHAVAKAAKDELRGAKESKSHELNTLQDKLEAREKEITELHAVANAAKDELRGAKESKSHELNMIQNKLDAREKEITELHAVAKTAKDESRYAKESKSHELNSIKNKLKARNREIAQLHAVANAAKEKLRGAKESNSHELDAIKDKLEAREKEIAQLHAVAKTAKDELRDAKDESHDMNRRYRILEEEFAILHHNNEGLQALNVHHAQEVVSKERLEVDSAIETPNEEIDCTKQRIRELEQEKATLSNELKVVSTQLGESFEIFAVHTQDKEALNEKLKAKRKELEDAKTKGRDMYEELTETRNRMKEVEDENALLKQSAVAGLWSTTCDTDTGGSEKMPQVKRSRSFVSSLESATACSDTSYECDYEGSNNSFSLSQRSFKAGGVNRPSSRTRSSFLRLPFGRKGPEDLNDELSLKDLACYESRGNSFFQNSSRIAPGAKELLQSDQKEVDPVHKESYPRSA